MFGSGAESSKKQKQNKQQKQKQKAEQIKTNNKNKTADHDTLSWYMTERKTHNNIKCEGCQMYPIVGVRFKCRVCPNYNMCGKCKIMGMDPAQPEEKEKEQEHEKVVVRGSDSHSPCHDFFQIVAAGSTYLNTENVKTKQKQSKT